MFKLKDKEQLYQWDSNIKVIVEDPSINQVQFSKRFGTRAYCVKVENGECYIPNELLQDYYDIRIYACIIDNEGHSTVYSEIMPVKARQKPDNYIYTPTEIITIESIKKEIDDQLARTVKVDKQNLTSEEQAQARKNIGAISAEEDRGAFYVNVTEDSGVYSSDRTFSQILEMYNNKALPTILFKGMIYPLIAIYSDHLLFENTVGNNTTLFEFYSDNRIAFDKKDYGPDWDAQLYDPGYIKNRTHGTIVYKVDTNEKSPSSFSDSIQLTEAQESFLASNGANTVSSKNLGFVYPGEDSSFSLKELIKEYNFNEYDPPNMTNVKIKINNVSEEGNFTEFVEFIPNEIKVSNVLCGWSLNFTGSGWNENYLKCALIIMRDIYASGTIIKAGFYLPVYNSSSSSAFGCFLSYKVYKRLPYHLMPAHIPTKYEVVLATGESQTFSDETKNQVLENIGAVSESDVNTELNTKLDKNQGTENAGKVLKVGTDGNVIPEEVSSSDGVLYVNVSEDGNGVYSSDKTFSQIVEAYDNGLFPIAVFEGSQCPLLEIGPEYLSFGRSVGSMVMLFDFQDNNDIHFDSWNELEEFFPIVNEQLNTKLDKNQGTENAGKILKVGTDGNVIPEEDSIPENVPTKDEVVLATGESQTFSDEAKDQIRKNIGAISAEEDRGVFYINITEENGKYTSDKTFYQISSIYNDKKILPIVVFNDSLYPLIQTSSDGFMFENSSGMAKSTFVIWRNKDIQHFNTNYFDELNTKLDKNQGTENAGKVLKVGTDGNVILEEVSIPENVPTKDEVVLATGESQTFDDSKKAKILTNIGAVSESDVNNKLNTKLDKNQGVDNYNKILKVGPSGKIITEDFSNLKSFGTIVEDSTNSINYFAKFKLINGKPVIEYEEEPKLSYWQEIQKIVRSGLASSTFSIGDQLVCNHATYGKIVWDIIGIDHDTPVNTEFTHSLTLQSHDVLNIKTYTPFDVAEPTNPDAGRVSSGSSNWYYSNIRQWLNSKGEANAWFTSQTEYDVAPPYASEAGFMKGLDSDFLSVIGEVYKDAANSSVDGGGIRRSEDKIFLLSRTEVYGGRNNTIEEGKVYAYYSENSDLSSPGTGADASRIKYLNGMANNWWLRSPTNAFANICDIIDVDGHINDKRASAYSSVAPACCIV